MFTLAYIMYLSLLNIYSYLISLILGTKVFFYCYQPVFTLEAIQNNSIRVCSTKEYSWLLGLKECPVLAAIGSLLIRWFVNQCKWILSTALHFEEPVELWLLEYVARIKAVEINHNIQKGQIKRRVHNFVLIRGQTNKRFWFFLSNSFQTKYCAANHCLNLVNYNIPCSVCSSNGDTLPLQASVTGG